MTSDNLKRPRDAAEDGVAEPASRRTRTSTGNAQDPDTPATQVLDPRGDLVLVAGECDVTTRFRVCSRSMARASPFWATMLFGPFMEGKGQQTTDDWSVALPEDDPTALSIVLRAVHGHLSTLPRTLSLDQLFSLAVVCDKYDMVRSLTTFWGGWVDTVEFGSYPSRTKLHVLVCQLQIAHALGYYHYFSATLVKLLSQLRQGDNDTLIFKGETGDEILDDNPQLAAVGLTQGLTPHQFPHHISAAVANSISEILVRARHGFFLKTAEPARDAAKALAAAEALPTWSRKGCQCEKASEQSRKLCNRALLGGLHCALQRLSLPSCLLDESDTSWPATRSEVPAEFMRLMEDVRTTAIIEAGTAAMKGDGESHTRCEPWQVDWDETANYTFSYSVVRVIEMDEERFERQQRKSGVRVPSSWIDPCVKLPRLFAELTTTFKPYDGDFY